ncbi:MAG: hypothetical protein F9K44_10580, partial [Hyphomicrobiaceae bacterium]
MPDMSVLPANSTRRRSNRQPPRPAAAGIGRPQLRERLEAQIADALVEQGGALAATVVLEAEHLCLRQPILRARGLVAEGDIRDHPAQLPQPLLVQIRARVV